MTFDKTELEIINYTQLC